MGSGKRRKNTPVVESKANVTGVMVCSDHSAVIVDQRRELEGVQGQIELIDGRPYLRAGGIEPVLLASALLEECLTRGARFQGRVESDGHEWVCSCERTS